MGFVTKGTEARTWRCTGESTIHLGRLARCTRARDNPNAFPREARPRHLRLGELMASYGNSKRSIPSCMSASLSAAAATISAPIGHLDVETVVKISQAVSGEMDLEKLVGALMRLAIEHSGAERGVLLLSHGNGMRQEAEALTSGMEILVRWRNGMATATPKSVIHTVVRTREIVILDDASRHPTYSADPYVQESIARSILCLPLATEAKVSSVLYLENNLTPYVFTPDRVTVLKVLASQAAIALKNSRLHRELARRERALRAAFDGIPGLVAILSPDGDVEAINRQIVEYCGRSLDELKDWGKNGTIHPEDYPQLADLLARSIPLGVPYDIEARLRRFDGEYRWFDIRGIPVRDTSDGVARWYVLLTDIEDRTRALTRLQQLQSDFAHMNRVSMMGELAASLSHEIMQPIASARNNARAARNFLDRQPPELGEVREALDCIVGDADRAGSIVDRIRDHVRKAPPRKEPFDLNAAIGQAIVLARSAIVRNRVSVQARLADGLVPVHGDRVQLQQVVLNLILNAVEAMGSVGSGARELSVSTRREGSDVRVVVRDSGPGIDAAQLERIFEPFYTTKASGVGMGLAICRSIVDAHGGRLWAEPNDPCGAVLQFMVPGTPVSS